MKTEQMIEKLQQAQVLLSDIYHEAPTDAVESQMSVADSCIIESIEAIKKLKTYRIDASYTVYLRLDVVADSIEKAQIIANNADGGDFKPIQNENWSIDSIREL